MPFKIVRNDITKMNTEAIVNTANDLVSVGTGCDHAVYTAAGYDELLKYREDNIGIVPEGDAFITPGFALQAKYIIHAVSPFYNGGNKGEEEKLRSCYRKSLQLAKKNNIKSISFPLISTGGFGYPKEEGMRIAIDEINAFLMRHNMLIYLVVFDVEATELGGNLYSDLEAYIDRKYVEKKLEEEYDCAMPTVAMRRPEPRFLRLSEPEPEEFDLIVACCEPIRDDYKRRHKGGRNR
jgi:O-acetyl-ADP-ribose deacetylase (regulator of RNase III)